MREHRQTPQAIQGVTANVAVVPIFISERVLVLEYLGWIFLSFALISVGWLIVRR